MVSIFVGKWPKLSVKLLSKIKFWKCGLQGGIFWPLHNLWHNLHMFLDIREFQEEEKMWSKICETMVYLSTKLLLEREEKIKLENLKPINRQQSLADSRDKTSSCSGFLKPHLQISFCWTIFCFLLETLGCLETCVNFVTNCVTPKFTPLKSNFSKFQKFERI